MEEKIIKELSDEKLVEIAGLPIPGQGQPDSRQIQAQAELTRRLMGSINNLNKETSRYSQTLVDLTVVLFVLGFFQLLVAIKSASSPEDEWDWTILTIVVLGTFYLTLWLIFRKKK
jgi:hypothetical protein